MAVSVLNSNFVARTNISEMMKVTRPHSATSHSLNPLADMKSKLQVLDEWYRRRLRMCIWKNWKKVKARFKNLMRCGIDKSKAWEWANTRKGYWRISNSWILGRALNTDILRQANYPFLMDCYRKVVS